MPSLAALRAFDAVARGENHSEAARMLNVTEAAVRQHVRGLEAVLDCPLVERSGRGLRLTGNGRRLAEATDEGFRALQRGVQDVRAELVNRPVRLSLTPAFAENWLMPRLGEFWTLHPDIEIELSPSLKLADLRSSTIDMAIRYGRGEWPGCTPVHLASAEYVVVAKPEMLEKRTRHSLSDLRSLPWVFEATRTEHREWAKDRGIDFDAGANRHYETNSLVLSAALAGQGLSLQSRALVERTLTAGALMEVYSEESGALGYYLVTQGTLRKNAAVFSDWLLGSRSGG
ncbi:UNVERIFIED_CONTAM: hypothetical protein GTU68_063701 [Idotea baltica]|nr:hypothetical protein [Idotea baltica]